MGREKLPETEMPNLPALPEEQLIANHNRAVLDAAETDRRYGDILPYQLDRVTQEIRFLLNQSAEAMLEAGRRLIQIKDREPTGEYLDALNKIGIDRFVASKLIRAARKFSNVRSNAHLMSLGKTKLIELAVMDEDEIDELANDQEVRGLELDEIACMSVRELRQALRKKDGDHAKDIEKLKAANTAKQRMIESKNLQIDDLQQKLMERESAMPSWPAVVNGINLDVTVAAGETLQGLDRLTRQLERILTVELPGEPADHDAALRMMAVHLYDLADQVMQAAQGFADACEANLSGYKTLG